jgi:hypothetical protein
MKKAIRRLKIHRETLRVLAHAELVRPVAGGSVAVEFADSVDNGCRAIAIAAIKPLKDG